MVYCVAYGCKRSSKTHKARDIKGWHYIPTEKKDRKLREKWIIAINRVGDLPKDDNCVVFSEDCFKRDFKAEFGA